MVNVGKDRRSSLVSHLSEGLGAQGVGFFGADYLLIVTLTADSLPLNCCGA